MSFFDKDITELGEGDYQWLVDGGFSEASVIEYKSQLNFGNNEEIEKVLSQVVSFSNARGGDIIYGINAEKGVPKVVLGQEIDDADGLIQRIENVLRQYIRPQLSSYEARAIKLSNDRQVIHFRVQRSWNRPHQFRFNNKYLFYTRSSNGLTQIDVEDLRNLFTGAADLRQRIEDFRTSRISDFLAGNNPGGKINPPILALHSVPISTFAAGEVYDPKKFRGQLGQITPSWLSGKGYFNFDGFISLGIHKDVLEGYTQVYRDCRIEIATNVYIWEGDDKVLSRSDLASRMLEMATIVLRFYQKLEVTSPALLMFTLIGVRGMKLAEPNSYQTREARPIDHEVLQLPAVYVNELTEKPTSLLRNNLDTLWQTANLPGCHFYDEEGNWKEGTSI